MTLENKVLLITLSIVGGIMLGLFTAMVYVGWEELMR